MSWTATLTPWSFLNFAGSSTTYPSLSLDGNTVYVPGGTTGPAKLWDRLASG